MVKYPFKKAETQNMAPKKIEKTTKRNKKFFLVSNRKTDIFVEFDEKTNNTGKKIKSSGSIETIKRIPETPKILKNEDRVNPITNPRFAKTKAFNKTPALKKAEIKTAIKIIPNSFNAPTVVL